MKFRIGYCVLLLTVSTCIRGSIFDDAIYIQHHRRTPALFTLLRKYSLWPPNPVIADPVSYDSSTDTQPFIVGGDSTAIELYPYQLSLRNGGVHICGATIIANKWALTAAHCLDDGSSASWITFRGGSPHRLAGGYIFHAVQLILHEKYDSETFVYDVAVVQIAENFFVDSLSAASLIDSSITVSCPDELAVVIGWGMDVNGYIPTILQELRVLIQPTDICRKMWIEKITDSMICAGGVIGEDTCNGDSGGPLICDGYQMGIVSWGSTACAIAMPAVFTNIADPEIRSFIRENAGV
ncbi:chymotrypsin-2-like [Armigeres subalbatus]|uniref:chymotrypsin-2-like n=1 Tax=Armigeres subalbatus TaxID=124917 RepID=UPI002ED13D8D